MTNRSAFLDMIAHSEIGQKLLDLTENGYRCIVGSTPTNPILMTTYDDHPRRLIVLSPTLKSTAAGRYQLLARYYDAYKKSLGLPDFSPDSQDAIAMQQIKERGALPDIDSGHFAIAVAKVSNIWASLPGAGYGQHENTLVSLQAAYESAGGTFA